MNIQQFLEQNNVDFEVLKHRETYEAQRMAQAVHVSGHHVAKTVLLRVGEPGDLIVAVLPASHKVDFSKAQSGLGVDKIELATEKEISAQCPDCEVGALPPFGSHYGMKTVVDTALTHDDSIVFDSNSHSESIRMKYEDFARLENPQVASFSEQAATAKT